MSAGHVAHVRPGASVRREAVEVDTTRGRVVVTSAYGMTRHTRARGDVADVIERATREHIRQAPGIPAGAFPGLYVRTGRGAYRVSMWAPVDAETGAR